LQWLTVALDQADAQTSEALVLSARVLSTRLAITVGDFARAEMLAASAEALAQQSGDIAARANAACVLGNLARGIGDQATANERYSTALEIYRQLNDPYNIGYTLIQMAKLGDLGTPERPGNPADIKIAEAQCREALAIYRELGNLWGIARALNHLSYLHYKAGRYPEAVAKAAEALPLFADNGNLTEGSQCIENLADIAGVTGHSELAARLYGMADGLQERMGAPMWPTYRAEYEQEVDRVRVLLDAETMETAWQAGRALSDEEMVADALAAAVVLASEPPAAPVETHGLTVRELDVLRLLATGASNLEIANSLFISVTTVKGHVQSIMRKLGLNSRTGLAAFAVRMRL
jgi:DNA-binding CsgD family transcriptional regulator